MPTFPTPDAVHVDVELVGNVRIMASDRADTVVTVRPGNPARPGDLRAAEQTAVEFHGGTVTVRAPRSWLRFTPFGGTDVIDVTIELPTGSGVTASSAMGSFTAEGELDECRFKTAMGNLHLDRTGPLDATTSYGSITVGRLGGDAELMTGTGTIRVEQIDGAATIKNSNGNTRIGVIAGDPRVKAANGDITVRRAHSSAVAKTASGDVRLLDVQRGSIVMETAAGEVEVGIREGTAAWFDVVTKFGTVRNGLHATDEPASTDIRAEVRARTTVGDILIGPAQPSATTTTEGTRR